MNSRCSLSYLNYFFKTLVLLSLFISSIQFACAESPNIVDFKLNGKADKLTFNPNNGESVSIDVKANRPIKFTRLYICSITQACTGSSGNYTRYFTQSFVSDTISKIWNGKTSGDAGFAPSGEYKVMVSMTEEGGGTTITAFGQFSIFLDFTTQASSTSEVGDTNGDDSDNTSDTTIKNLDVGDISTHSSTDNLSNYKDGSVKLKVSAGRERLAYVGLPIELSASTNLSLTQNISFEWSFGDGFKQNGKLVYHTYNSPGEYVVILNGTNSEEVSVSRTKVSVLEPELSLAVIDTDSVSIKNNGKFEINIGDLKLQKGFEVFTVAKDTIVTSNNTITLSNIFKNKEAGTIFLKNISGDTITRVDVKKDEATSLDESEAVSNTNIISDENKFNDFLLAFKKIPNAKSVTLNKPKMVSVQTGFDNIVSGKEHNLQPANVLDAVSDGLFSTTTAIDDNGKKVGIKPVSIWRKIWSAPVSLYKKIKNSFYETE